MLDDRKVAAMELKNYKKGSLWWGREYLLRRSRDWHYSDRYRHPLLSVCETKVTRVMEQVPMLVGSSSSSKGERDIPVKMDEDRSKVTHFGLRVHPVIYVDDFFMSGVPLEPGVKVEPKDLRDNRSLCINFPKTQVNDIEMRDVERYIEEVNKK